MSGTPDAAPLDAFAGLCGDVLPRPRAAGAYGDDLCAVVGGDSAARARRHIASWPGYAPTPMRDLAGLAVAAGIGALHYKDEGPRFGLGSFKALGGPYAVFRLLAEDLGGEVTVADLTAPEARARNRAMTVCCATAGNHGRAVAWAARTFGCRAVIYVSEGVSAGRAEAMARLGAEVVRVPGQYEDALAGAVADAGANGWHLVSDTAGADFGRTQLDILDGYTMLMDEALAQLPAGRSPSHVFAQGGVGGLCAGVLAHLWETLGRDRPRFVVVEPETAACLHLSARNGRPSVFPGDCASVMSCLAYAEVNVPAWRVLARGADAFLTISDAAAVAAMRLLAAPVGGDGAVVAGESGVAAVAGLLAAMADAAARKALGLDAASRVLVIGSEGATDPALYERIVGRAPGAVAP